MIIALAISIASFSYAQEASDLAFIVKSNPLEGSSRMEKAGLNLRQTSEVKLILLGSIRLYQLFVSSQDEPVCNFTPSCSQFGMEAIQRYGLLKGILLTSDRLQRCHSWVRDYYPLDDKSKKAKDPIESYLFLGDRR
jgi:hypothetical protein